jgi:hypothetical protein
MVKGLEKFKEFFAGFEDNYVIIGGIACDIALRDTDMRPRATDDIAKKSPIVWPQDFCFYSLSVWHTPAVLRLLPNTNDLSNDAVGMDVGQQMHF